MPGRVTDRVGIAIKADRPGRQGHSFLKGPPAVSKGVRRADTPPRSPLERLCWSMVWGPGPPNRVVALMKEGPTLAHRLQARGGIPQPTSPSAARLSAGALAVCTESSH